MNTSSESDQYMLFPPTVAEWDLMDLCALAVPASH